MFVANEKTWTSEGKKTVSSFYLEHTPVGPGTTTGVIHLGDEEEYTFVIGPSGEFVPSCLRPPLRWNQDEPPHCIRGLLNAVVGELVLIWDMPPGPHHVVVSYEYVIEDWDEKKNTTAIQKT